VPEPNNNILGGYTLTSLKAFQTELGQMTDERNRLHQDNKSVRVYLKTLAEET